jgi:hypothetical protein
MLSRPPARRRAAQSGNPDAVRKRRGRARERYGLARYELVLPVADVTDAMLGSGRIASEAEAAVHSMLEFELEQMVLDWTKRWREKILSRRDNDGRDTGL